MNKNRKDFDFGPARRNPSVMSPALGDPRLICRIRGDPPEPDGAPGLPGVRREARGDPPLIKKCRDGPLEEGLTSSALKGQNINSPG